MQNISRMFLWAALSITIIFSFPCAALADDTVTPAGITTGQGVEIPLPEDAAPTDPIVEELPVAEIPPAPPSSISINGVEITVTAYLEDPLPASWAKNLRYTKYPVPLNYAYITAASVYGRALPSTKAKALKSWKKKERIAAKALVKSSSGDDKDWIMVEYYKDGKSIDAFIPATAASLRGFQLSRGAEMITRLEAFTTDTDTAYVNNYKNRAGLPPSFNGKTVDGQGNRRDQAAPLYQEPGGELLRYLDDGSILQILEESDSWAKISSPEFNETYWTPAKYLSREKAITNLTQAVIVDRRSQNIAVFEKNGGVWTLISLSLATTGGNDKYRIPTPLGTFQAIERRSRFQFLGDISKEIEGYAPYATRFSGGAYIHGVPVNYVVKLIERAQPAPVDDGIAGPPVVAEKLPPIKKVVDPGMREYLSSIGTVPLSHKCVRNYTSHAKFIYDWVDIGHCAIFVIE